MEKIKILIIEDEIIIGQDLKNILSSANFEVCGIAESYDIAIKMFCQENPDIVICDIYLKGTKTGIDFANKINKLHNSTIIFITAFSSNEIMNKINDMQNISYITKPFTNSQVIAAVKLASYRIKNHSKIPELTARQEEILILIKEGITINAAIAKKLNIGIDTVKSHKRQIYQKFKVSSTPELLKLLL
jgi:two-component system, response regulator PdtaR